MLPDPPEKLLATVDDAEVERHRHVTSPVTISFALKVVGYRGERLDVCWSLLALPRGSAPPEKRSEACTSTIEPEADAQTFVDEVIVPVPRRAGAWIVRLWICHGGRDLARAQTTAFRVDSTAPVRSGDVRGSWHEPRLLPDPVVSSVLQRRIARRDESRGLALVVQRVQQGRRTSGL